MRGPGPSPDAAMPFNWSRPPARPRTRMVRSGSARNFPRAGSEVLSRDLAKPFALRFFNMLLCPHADLGGSLSLVHAPANDRADNLVQCRSVPHPKWVGFAQGLPYRSVAVGGPLIRPDEHIAKQFDAVQLVYTEHCVSIDALRQALERQGAIDSP